MTRTWKIIGGTASLVGAIGALGSGIDKAQSGVSVIGIMIPLGCAVLLMAVGVSLLRQPSEDRKT